MFNFPKRSSQDSRPSSTDSVMASSVQSGRTTSDIERELVRVAFKDTVRATGVPSDWLGCEVRVVTDKYMTERLQVQLVVKKWSGHLLRYAMAFQQQLTQCLDRYDPTTDHSQYEWLWSFSPSCGCPFPTMPAPEEWAQKLEASKAKKPTEFFERRKTPRTASAKVLPQPGTVPAAAKPDLRDVFSHL